MKSSLNMDNKNLESQMIQINNIRKEILENFDSFDKTINECKKDLNNLETLIS